MDRLEVQDQLRAQDVIRWNIVAVTKRQTLAEHTFNVIVIARAIAKEFGINSRYIGDVVLEALDHDMAEVITGDIPTPTKERMREQDFEPDRLIKAKLHNSDSTIIHKVVDFADLMEAVWFITDFGQGRPGHVVKSRIQKRFTEKLDSEKNGDLTRAVRIVWGKMLGGEYTI